MRKSNLAARAARILFLCSLPNDDVKFEVLTTTGARCSKSFILRVYMKTIYANQMKRHFAHFLQCDQHGQIAKQLTCLKFVLTVSPRIKLNVIFEGASSLLFRRETKERE